MMAKIFIYEEQQLFSETLQFFINSQEDLEVVGTSNDETFLLEFLRVNDADIILFGINKMNSRSCCLLDELRNEFTHLKILVLNDGLDMKEVRKLFKNGVNGLVEKSSHHSELLKCIESIISGNVYVDFAIRERLFSDFFEANHQTKPSSNLYHELTSREIDVLKLICEGYNSKEIAEELFISINTVETHRKKIIQKFNVKNSIGIVRYALQNNMI